MSVAPSSSRLDGSVAVITGAASGIGRAIARRYAAEGARVVLGDLFGPGVDDLVRELGPEVAAGQFCDVTAEADVESLCALSISRFGRLDVAVANAGRGGFGMIVDHDVAEFRALLDLCVTGVMLTIKHAGRVMSDGGSIITMSSLNGVQPSAGMSAYCTAKAGVIMLTRVAAMELGGRGIRVNAIGPGLVETPATGTFFELPGIVEEFVENTTLGRFAQPEEIAALALWLATDESRFVSGAYYPIDGGASTKRYPDLPGAIARAMGG